MGSGGPRRELLHAEDLADACVFLMRTYDAAQIGEFVNLGTGHDREAKEIVQMVKDVVGFDGAIRWDTSKPGRTPKKLSDLSWVNQLGVEGED